MEDEDDEEELSDQEMSGPADSSTRALFPSFAGPSLGSPNSNANTTSEAANKAGTADERLEGSKPFEVLRDLLCHHAHLAVFMNYVISNSDPSALVIYFHYHSFISISLHHCRLFVKLHLVAVVYFWSIFFPIKNSVYFCKLFITEVEKSIPWTFMGFVQFIHNSLKSFLNSLYSYFALFYYHACRMKENQVF